MLYSQLFSSDFLFAPFPPIPSSSPPPALSLCASDTGTGQTEAKRGGMTISATGECERLGPTEWQRRLRLNINGL